MNMSGVLDTINKPNAEPEDYPGKDGLLYCGKCHTPKQMHGTGFAANKILSITCECQTKKLETEKVESERKKIEELREQCIPTEATRGHIFSKADDPSEKHIRNAKNMWTVGKRFAKEMQASCSGAIPAVGKAMFHTASQMRSSIKVYLSDSLQLKNWQSCSQIIQSAPARSNQFMKLR